jgi:DNA-binding transcriptional MerR regulator
MAMHKETYTTGEIAKLCSVSPRTVCKWFDSGLLQGFKVPGSKFRKVTHPQLMAFMREHGIDVPADMKDKPKAQDAPKRPARDKQADAAWKRITSEIKQTKRTVKDKAVHLLDSNLQALSILSPLERRGYLQATADVVADFERIERERGL